MVLTDYWIEFHRLFWINYLFRNLILFELEMFFRLKNDKSIKIEYKINQKNWPIEHKKA